MLLPNFKLSGNWKAFSPLMAHFSPGMELIPKKSKFEFKLLYNFVVEKTHDTITQHKSFSSQSCMWGDVIFKVGLWWQALFTSPFSGLMFVASVITCKLKLVYILNEMADLQNCFFHLTGMYLLFSKIQITSLKSLAEKGFFSRWTAAF